MMTVWSRADVLDGAPDDAQVRARAHGSPDEVIRAEAVVEGAQVVVDAQREAHALQGLLGDVGAVGSGHQHHAVTRRLADADDRGHALDVEQSLEAAVAPAAHDAVPSRTRQAKGPRRTHLSPHLDHRGPTLRLASDGRRTAPPLPGERSGEADERQP